jgi:hypothetical protein
MTPWGVDMRRLRLVDEDGDVIYELDEEDVRSMLNDYYVSFPDWTVLDRWLNA